MGGGGSKPQTSTTSSGVPDWARPYLQKAAGDATKLYDSGALENVAGLNADQVAASSGIRANTVDANTTFNQAQQGGGIFGANAYGQVAGQLQPQIDNQITRALGAQEGAFSQSGNLGGARAQAASAGAAGQIASDMSSAEVQAQRNSAMGGANAGLNAYTNLGQSGQALQDQEQAELDAQYQGIQRMFGLINPGTVGSTQTTNSTGGGK
jgi:hypothetical protein